MLSHPCRKKCVMDGAPDRLRGKEARDLVDEGGLVFEDFGNDGDLVLGELPVFLVHGFAHGGQGLDAVPGVGAGSVDLMLEPGTPGRWR